MAYAHLCTPVHSWVHGYGSSISMLGVQDIMDMDDSISMMSWTQETRYSGAKQETNIMDMDDSISMMCVCVCV